MPNPFPGMNPYLEDATLWRGVHSRLLAYIADALQVQLPPNYVALLDERVQLGRRDIIPDVLLSRAPNGEAEINGAGNGHSAPEPSGGGTSTLTKPVIVVVPDEHREPFIEIRDARDGEVITVIEVLSPTNKTGAGEGQLHYLSKLRHLFLSATNLVEIDLLRGGLPTAAADIEPNVTMPLHDYLVSVSRGEQRSRYEVYPVGLRESLPNVAVPLRPDETDVALELQPLLNRVYDNGAFARLIDYRPAPPLPPLSESDAAWLDALLREKGLRAA